MLDTNIVSQLLRSHPKVLAQLESKSVHQICISAITEAELRFGLARRPDALALQTAVHAFLRRATVRPWDSNAALQYGTLRARLQAQGKALAPMDMLIAAHAFSINAVLVCNDSAFQQLSTWNAFKLEDWTQ